MKGNEKKYLWLIVKIVENNMEINKNNMKTHEASYS